MVENLSAGRAIAEGLLKMGATRIYGIIGTSNLGFADALYDYRDRIRYISCRHEQVAASMADAEGRLCGRPGVVMAHSGPGALNTMISAGNAMKDSSPFIIITGAVKRRLEGSGGMLELDHRGVFELLTKGAYRLESAAEVTAVLSDAYRASMSGARGPVLIEVPEDVWGEQVSIETDSFVFEADPAPGVRADDVSRALEMLRSSKLPLILSGGGVAYSRSSGLLVDLAESLGVPVITTGNGRGTIPETHPLCFGRVGFGGGSAVADKALERADSLLCLGAAVSDMTTYEFTLPVGAERIIMVNVSPDSVAPQAPEGELIVADVAEFLRLAVDGLRGGRPRHTEWDGAIEDAKALWEGMKQAALAPKGERPSGGQVISALSCRVPADTIVSVGAGMHLLYPMAFMPCMMPLTFLSTVNFGSMGFGLAASMAARLAYPERTSIAVLGDGDFMMTVQDLETAVREGIVIKVFVLNDCQYRVLNVRQKLQFQGRTIGTEHGNPAFDRLAETFGAKGFRIERPDDIEGVLEGALAEEGPAVVDVMIDPEDLPPMNIEANLRMSAG